MYMYKYNMCIYVRTYKCMRSPYVYVSVCVQRLPLMALAPERSHVTCLVQMICGAVEP